MKHNWTFEKLTSLSPQHLDVLRQNAQSRGETELAYQCLALQESRKKRPDQTAKKILSPVVGFHFVCQDDYEVQLLQDGKFWSGVWAVDQTHCRPAKQLRGYVALHQSKRNVSYRQGLIVDWKLEARTKGSKQIGVSFLLSPFSQSLPWYGAGSGEKGYRRADDLPRWAVPA
jgi:hypothetical protein